MKLNIRKKERGVLVSRIASPYPGANHVAPPDTKGNATTFSKLWKKSKCLCTSLFYYFI